MAYSSTNPVQVMHSDLASGHSVLVYRSTHTHANIEATGFFTDGRRHGMKAGDLLFHIHHSTDGSSAATAHVVIGSTGAIAATSTYGSSAYNQAYNASVTVAST